MAGDLVSALVELAVFDWLPEIELELHAASTSVLAVSSRIPDLMSRPRCLCIVVPPAFQSTLRTWRPDAKPVG